MSAAGRLSAVLVGARKPAAIARWYAEHVLRVPCELEGRDGEPVGFSLGDLYLGFEAESDRCESARVTLWFAVDDAHEACTRLQAAGAALIEAPRDDLSPGECLARLTDPEGNPIGLIGPASATKTTHEGSSRPSSRRRPA